VIKLNFASSFNTSVETLFIDMMPNYFNKILDSLILLTHLRKYPLLNNTYNTG